MEVVSPVWCRINILNFPTKAVNSVMHTTEKDTRQDYYPIYFVKDFPFVLVML